MFPGGGTQYVNMGRELYETEPVFRRSIDACAELLRPRIGYDLREVLYAQGSGVGDQGIGNGRAQDLLSRPLTPDPRSLNQTSVALPALFMVEYALAQLWMSWGVRPAALIGHSLGEYVAACIAGVFSLEDALALVLLRGQLIEQLPSGAMLSVSLGEADLGPLMNEQLSLAAINGPSLCVVSGPLAAIEALATMLRKQSIGFRRIKIDAAGHSELITPILAPFTQFVKKLRLHAPSIPYISNVTGTWISAAEATDPHYWARHLRQTVRFAAGVAELLQDPARILLEVGPGQALTALARQQPRQGAQTTVLASTRHRHETRSDVAVVLETLGQLWLAGVRVDWTAFSADEQRRRLPLPTYPFERQRYWIEPQRQTGTQRGLSQRKADVADWFYIPSWKLSLPPAPLQPGTLAELGARWLVCIDDGDMGLALVNRLEQAGQDVIAVRAGPRFERLADRVYTLDPRSADDYAALVQELRSLDKLPDIVVHLWSLTPPSAQPGSALFKQAQDRGYYSLLFMCHALEAAQISAPLRIEVVSNQLHSITDAEVALPEKATLLGPCKVIPQEYPNITCHCIDIVAPAPDAQASRLIEQVLAEIAANTPDRVIAYRGGQRWVQTFEQVRLDDGVKPSRALRDQGVYLITGGLGNVGLLLAKQLAQTGTRLTLLGRSALPPRDEWPRWLETHEPREELSHKMRSVLELEALGAEVLVLAADVADAEQMRAALAQTTARFGALHGVIHAAGITSGASIFQPISAIRRDESEAQFQPKAYGLYVLAELLRGQALDFCLLISSNATILGGLGLVAYSAANLFMDAFAAQQSKLGAVSWISSNWDGWPARADDRLQAAVSTSLDQYAMTPKAAVDAFSRIVTRATVAQLAVSAGDLPARIDFWIRQLAAARAAEQHTDAPELHPRPELQSSYVAPRNAIEQALADMWQTLLGIDEVGVEDNFFRLGGHSLLATQLTSRVRDTFKLALPVRSLFEAPTIAALAKRIEQALAEQRTTSGPKPRRRSATTRTFPASFAQQRLWFLDQLEPGNPFYNDAAAVRLSGALNLAALGRSLAAVVRRHEALRTTFAAQDGDPVQVIAPVGPVAITLIDLRALPAAEREPTLLALAGQERLRSFDLSRGPLLRVGVLRLDQTEHVLFLTMHHIIADAWSMGILIRELAALYDACVAGQPSPLPALPIQYADFAIWQRERLQGEGDQAESPLQAQLAYWRGALANAPSLLALPTDRPRPATQSYLGATHMLTLPRSVVDALAALSQQAGATLFMTLLATFQLLLACYSGQDDIVVGTNVANRNQTETEGIIGFFVNMLVLRSDLSGDPTFRELLGRVREVALNAYAHQDVPFEQLVAELRPERNRSYAPLFQVVFTLQNAPLALPQMPGLTMTPLKIASSTAKYDIVFNIAEGEQGLIGALEYNTQLFDAATITRLASHFATLLEAISTHADERLSALAATLPELDRQQQQQQAEDFKAARLQKFKQVKRKTISGAATEHD
jgi:acyl transferase domain-containing protein